MPISGIDLSNIDHSVRPQDDLYQHVNGSWLKATEIPDDRPLEGTFTALRDGAEIAVRDIIEEAAAKGEAASGIERKVGDLYNSFMDEATVEAKGMDPIRGRLAEVFATTTVSELVALAGRLFRCRRVRTFLHLPRPGRRQPGPRPALHRPGRPGAARRVLLPRRKVRPHGAAATGTTSGTMFSLAGVADRRGGGGPGGGPGNRPASHHWDNVTLRDPQKTYNLKSADEAAALFPLLDTWFDAAGIDAEQAAAKSSSARLTSSAGQRRCWTRSRCRRWQEWLALRVINAAAPYLSAEFVDANFAFYGTTISGTPRNKDRWKRAVAVVEAAWAKPSDRSTCPSTSPSRTRPACRPWWPT